MQPKNNRIIALKNVTFTCTARGFEVKYEWRRHNSSDIIGRWSNLTITRATPPDEDQYYCIAMTEGGYVFSDNVTLSVDGEQCSIVNNIVLPLSLDPITIIQPPEDVLVRDGGTLMLTITAQGPGHDKFTYQWKKMGSNSLPSRANGVNTTQIVITSVTTSDRGSYYCIVTNQWDRMLKSMKAEVKVLCEFPITLMVYLAYYNEANFTSIRNFTVNRDHINKK